MSLARNAVFNLGGALVPALAALLTVPVLVAHLGSAQYGVLILVTSIVGYFAILDINATAGSVKYIAQHQARGEAARVRQVLSFGAALYLAIGLVGGGLIVVYAAPLAQRGFKVPPELQAEATLALRWAGAAFLLGQVQTYLQSVPQALQRYDLTGRLEAVFGTAVSVLSMAAAWLGLGLVGVVVVRLLLSVVNVGVLLVIIRRLLPGAAWLRPDAATVRAVGSFSLFSYLTRLAAISAANTDKLFIGALVDMKALAYYAVPALLVNRVYALAYRLAQVVFPRASALASAGRHEQLRRTYLDATRYVSYANAALLCLLVGLAPEIMHYWAGAEFGGRAVVVMLLLAAAVFADSLTNLPSMVNDGLGHPQVSGVGAVLRAAVGMAAAWVGVNLHGILGAAVALLAVSLTAAALFIGYVHRRTVPVTVAEVLAEGWLPALPALLAALALAGAALVRPLLAPWPGLAALLALGVLLALYGWHVVLLPGHRLRLGGALRARLSSTR